MTLRTLNYGNYGIFLIMGNAGFCPSTVTLDVELLATFLRGSIYAHTYATPTCPMTGSVSTSRPPQQEKVKHKIQRFRVWGSRVEV